MSNILNSEIRRLARSEAIAQTKKVKADNAYLKHVTADLKRRVTELKKENKRLSRYAEAGFRQATKPSNGEVERARITGKMVKAIRSKFGLTQAEFSELLEVTPVTVYNWESKKKSRLTFRGNAKERIVEVRKLGVRDIQRRLNGVD